MRTFKTLPSVYKGVTYRSRVEARWAIFLDELDIGAQYEPEGVKMDEVYYLPDFFISDLDIYVEVKGGIPTEEERQKCRLLAACSGKDVLLAIGDPGTGRGELYRAKRAEPTEYYEGYEDGELNAFIGECRLMHCGEIVLAEGDMCGGFLYPSRNCGNPERCGDKFPTLLNDRIARAIAAARDYRFNHGN
jgi:hypothetical protein